MSNGEKKESTPTQNKPKPPAGYEVWLDEYRAMVRLAAKAEREDGQTDTYWHTRKKALEAAFKEYGLDPHGGN